MQYVGLLAAHFPLVYKDLPICWLSLNFLFSASCDINFTVSDFQYGGAKSDEGG